MRQLLGEPGDVFSRDHFVPGHFTASAFVVSLDRTSLALIHHRRLGRWLQPGGHMEPGDVTAQAAASREVLEEIGVQATLLAPLIFDIDVHDIPAHGSEPGHEHFDLRFAFEADLVELNSGAGVKGAAWVPLNDVTDHTTDGSVIRGARKASYLR
jgi:8-oxo-dGTP pyrophosphatase MutT (NUDIX family)